MFNSLVPRENGKIVDGFSVAEWVRMTNLDWRIVSEDGFWMKYGESHGV